MSKWRREFGRRQPDGDLQSLGALGLVLPLLYKSRRLESMSVILKKSTNRIPRLAHRLDQVHWAPFECGNCALRPMLSEPRSMLVRGGDSSRQATGNLIAVYLGEVLKSFRSR